MTPILDLMFFAQSLPVGPVENPWQALVAIATIALVAYQIFASQKRDKITQVKVSEAATNAGDAKKMLNSHLEEYKRVLDAKHADMISHTVATIHAERDSMVAELKSQIAALQVTAHAAIEAKAAMIVVQAQNALSIEERATLQKDVAALKLAAASKLTDVAELAASKLTDVATTAASKLTDVATGAASGLTDVASSAASKLVVDATPIPVTIVPAAEPLPVSIETPKESQP